MDHSSDLSAELIKEAIDILLKIKAKITDDSDLMWTSFETANELRNEIDAYISELKANRKEIIHEVYSHFLPASTFQEHSMQNGWSEDYHKWAKRFDSIYETLK